VTESKVDLSSPHLSRARRLFIRYFDPDGKGFDGFQDPRYLEQERNYKVTTAELAARLLSEPELRALVDAGNAEEVLQRARQVGQKSNLLYLAVPQTGDLAPLLRPLEPAPRLSLARGILELLHGAEAVAERVDRFLALLTSLGLPAHWQLFSYLLFFVHPGEEVFIKPTAIGRALELLGAPVELAEAPSGRVYERVRSIARTLRQELADWQPADLIDVQSFLFVVALAFERSAPLEIKQHKELRKLLSEFRDGYLKTAAGKQHLASYERDRLAIQANFHAVLEQERQGLDTTDTVLCKLLPHSDTAPNRDSGKLVSIAPVITTDLRQWFEGVKWATPEDWPGIARAILRFYQRCQADPAVLEVAVKEFLAQEIKGIQAGYLSPILAGLRPDQFRISNKKPRQVLGYLRNQEYGAGLDQYPRFNSDLGELLTWIEPDLVALCDAPGQPAADLFDCYSHWLVGVRNFFNRKYWKIAPGELAHDWERQLSAGVIAIGWEKIKDLSWFDSKEVYCIHPVKTLPCQGIGCGGM